ncbi:MAG: IS21 family transposase [Caldilineaceae bacterium]
MKTVEDYEAIRRAYFIEQLSIRAIRRELGYDRETIRKAITHAGPPGYQLKEPRAARVLGPYQAKIKELLDESDKQRRKQRYTAHRIYELLMAEGYTGSEGAVHNYVSRQRKKRKPRPAFLPLEFEAGRDAQADWCEAEVELDGVRRLVKLFIMRLNYSRVRFVMAFPFEKQEAFFAGHIEAFAFFGGVPQRITYDNLKTAVFKILEGRNRQEQATFKTFRSHYLFESNYCTPGQGHEKGGVENDVGYVQRNFMAPVLKVKDYAELNRILRQACLDDVQRHVRGQESPVAELWRAEQASLLPLPRQNYAACISYPVKPNAYSQVELETNRYSVPVTVRDSQLVLQAYPFQIRILSEQKVIAEHARCFGREQDIVDPLHYLPLLEQRPGAFEYALPVRQWRRHWPPAYEELLAALRRRWPEGRGVREFIAVLKLHQVHPSSVVEAAVHEAVELGAAHLDGVQLCLRQRLSAVTLPPGLEMHTRPELAQIGCQPVNLQQYDQLLARP